jgi:hypothetical protein
MVAACMSAGYIRVAERIAVWSLPPASHAHVLHVRQQGRLKAEHSNWPEGASLSGRRGGVWL